MDFRIADTFTDSLAKLTGEEQKAAKTTAFDLQLNPANPGMSFHKLDNAKDKNFWAVRVSSDLRLIVHKAGDGLLLCYVDHHDRAYQWAERRKLQTSYCQIWCMAWLIWADQADNSCSGGLSVTGIRSLNTAPSISSGMRSAPRIRRQDFSAS